MDDVGLSGCEQLLVQALPASVGEGGLYGAEGFWCGAEAVQRVLGIRVEVGTEIARIHEEAV